MNVWTDCVSFDINKQCQYKILLVRKIKNRTSIKKTQLKTITTSTVCLQIYIKSNENCKQHQQYKFLHVQIQLKLSKPKHCDSDMAIFARQHAHAYKVIEYNGWLFIDGVFRCE